MTVQNVYIMHDNNKIYNIKGQYYEHYTNNILNK
jgi:hypothetical protein